LAFASFLESLTLYSEAETAQPSLLEQRATLLAPSTALVQTPLLDFTLLPANKETRDPESTPLPFKESLLPEIQPSLSENDILLPIEMLSKNNNKTDSALNTSHEEKRHDEAKDITIVTGLPFIPVALPTLVPVQDQVKALVNTISDTRIHFSRPAIIIPPTLLGEKSGEETLSDTPHQAEAPSPETKTKALPSSSAPLSLSAVPSIPVTQDDLDAALNAMANLKAPVQVAENQTVTDRLLAAPLSEMPVSTVAEVQNATKGITPVLAQAVPAAVKPLSSPSVTGPEKKTYAVGVVKKETNDDVAVAKQTPEDTTPVRMATFEDKTKDSFAPLKTADLSVSSEVNPVKIESFGESVAKEISKSADLSGPATPGLPVASHQPALDQNSSLAPRIAAFHQAAALTPMETQHARENLAMTIKKGMDDENTQIRIKMSPERLGTVDVAMEIAQDGTVNAVIGTDRQDTYDWLRRDASSLQDMLQQAGLKMGQGGLSFAYHDQRQAFEQKVAGLKGRSVQADPDVKTVAMRPLSYNPNQALDIHA
jgi:hypothetical protein